MSPEDTKTGDETAAPPAKKQPLTKAERRALQEKQRAAKALARGEAPPDASKPQQQQQQQPPKQQQQQQQHAKKQPQHERKPPQKESFVESYLGHLPEKKQRPMELQSALHPAVVALGLRYAAGAVDGSNERCVEMLRAFKSAVKDYACPPSVAVGRDLDKTVVAMFDYLTRSRPHAVSMGAAVKHLRGVVSRFDPGISEDDAKAVFADAVDAYVREKIVLPGRLIGDFGAAKIRRGDVVATYGCGGDAVEAVFRRAASSNISFSVVVVDGASPALSPKKNDSKRRLVALLHALGVATTYVHLRAVNFALARVDALFLGADAVFSNGSAQADAGTAALAMAANDNSVPVLFCAESYKFHASVRLDALASNELVPFFRGGSSSNEASSSPVPPSYLHLRFDLTPPRFITAIITEHGLIPPTSSAVLVRELEAAAVAPQPPSPSPSSSA